jgi:hypothetical protein
MLGLLWAGNEIMIQETRLSLLCSNTLYSFKDEAQTALFKDPVRTAL